MEQESAEYMRGWCAALDAVEASLRNYPNGGGHKPIMDLVDSIRTKAEEDAFDIAAQWR